MHVIEGDIVQSHQDASCNSKGHHFQELFAIFFYYPSNKSVFDVNVDVFR